MDNCGADLLNSKDAKVTSMTFDSDMELDAMADTLKSLCTQVWKRGGWRSRNCMRIVEQMKMLNVIAIDGRKT